MKPKAAGRRRAANRSERRTRASRPQRTVRGSPAQSGGAMSPRNARARPSRPQSAANVARRGVARHPAGQAAKHRALRRGRPGRRTRGPGIPQSYGEGRERRRAAGGKQRGPVRAHGRAPGAGGNCGAHRSWVVRCRSGRGDMPRGVRRHLGVRHLPHGRRHRRRQPPRSARWWRR